VLRGAVSQLAFLIGMVVGLWAAGWVSQWVGEHWLGARPAVVFWVLRWLVALLAGLSALAIAQWSGERVGQWLRDGPFGWLDRLLGVAAGAALGVVLATLLVLVSVRLVPGGHLAASLAASRCSLALIERGEQVCGAAARQLPASGWLRHEFGLAERRMHGIRSSGPTSAS
jgi:hypothetical protein